MAEKGSTRKGVLAGAAALALAGLTRASDAAAQVAGSWQWFQGDDRAYIGGADGDAAGTLAISAEKDLDIGANHIRFGAQDGNYEFEHGEEVPATHLNSYSIGTPNRTPISVGGDDGQDVLSFVVYGKAGQENDLQQWAPGSKVTAAIDGNGHLRLGNVVITADIQSGRARLIAVLPDGEKQVLALGTSQTTKR
jgi:hypothetical protein